MGLLILSMTLSSTEGLLHAIDKIEYWVELGHVLIKNINKFVIELK